MVLEVELAAPKPQLEIAQQNAVATLKWIEVREECKFVINPLVTSRVSLIVNVKPLSHVWQCGHRSQLCVRRGAPVTWLNPIRLPETKGHKVTGSLASARPDQ